MTRRLAVTAAALAPAVLAAQEAGAPPPGTRFGVTARLVEISVVAETVEGRPMPGLSQSDFTVFDEGDEQTLALFSVESSRMSRPAPRPAPANTYTNRFEQLGETPTAVTAVLFDGLNTRIEDQAFARDQIVRFLLGLQPGERVAIYLMGRGPRVVQEFTSDPGSLLQALREHRGSREPALDAPLCDPALTPVSHFDAWFGELSFQLIDYFDRDRAFRTVRAITAIARHLERLPGRKNLVWVSGSFPVAIDGGSIALPERVRRGLKAGWPETDRLARALSRAGLAVYPVDARGLLAPQNYRADRAGVSADDSLRDAQMFGIMRTLAERTGGRAFYQNNDLASAFRRAADDTRVTYLLGYYPSHDDWTGKFRRIRVATERSGVRLLHRAGYFALPEEPRESWYREETLEAAMFSPLEASGIGLTAGVGQGEGGGLDLDLGIDSRDITFEPSKGNWDCALDVWLIQMDRRERHLKTDARTTRLSLSQLDYQRVMQAGGLRLMERMKPASGALLVRVMVRDIASGALGSVTVPLSVFATKPGTATPGTSSR